MQVNKEKKTTTLLNKVVCEDSITGLSQIASDSIHLILSDIPYGISVDDWDVLHTNTNSALLGNSPAQKKAGAVFKSRGKPINGWSEADKAIPREYYEWCLKWSGEWLRILKPGGSAIVFAGRRLAHRCISALEDTGFSYKDMLAWERSRAPHRAQRISVVYDRRDDNHAAERWQGWRVGNLRPTFEPILWFSKPYKVGTTIADNVLSHEVGAFNQNAFSRYSEKVENVLRAGFSSNETGKHPTQKPIELMQALIELTTIEGQIVLDPFCGSGSTLVAAKYLSRNYIGFEKNPEYFETTENRLSEGLL